mmetsp:Transcript_49196/g.81695  ORF Transcript_49196/g.81695 Transcript_49196/m.81695 type:complete len:1065 (-) Transcript_49196:122-3316(-)
MGCAGSTGKGDNPSTQPATDNPDEYPKDDEDYAPLTQEEVNERITCSDSTLYFKPKHGFKLKYAYLSQRGYYPEDLYKNNQDSFKIIPNFNDDPDTIFFGVFDGHGSDGDSCSYYVRDNIERCLKDRIRLYPLDFERAYKEAFVQVNNEMHDQEFDDTMSGTTAITAYFNKTEVFVANIGDSRAIIGEKKGKRVIAYSLSIDQTPYRQDERERVKQAGAVIMSCDQLEGITEYHENWNVALGDELDNGGDPPRVWAPGKSFPGCAFTRSIGDSVAEGIGVFAEPELLCKEVTEDDEFIMIASDGVWEFLTNQSVADMVMKFDEPVEACRAVVAESYRLWLQYEVRTDDITMILAIIDADGGMPDLPDPDDPSQKRRMSQRRQSRRGSAQGITVGMDLVGVGGENRPVRRGLSREKRSALTVQAAEGGKEEEDDHAEYNPTLVPKTEEELERLQQAVKANFLFQHLNQQQEQLVFDVMQRVPTKKGDVIIRQGDAGDRFYVVESGEFTVTINQGGKEVEILQYTTAGGTNPCFGELALMYKKPRAATVTCAVDGLLWAMDRKSFRKILMKSSSKDITRTLRSVDVLKALSVGQLQRLEDILTEVSYKDGDYVIQQGEYTETFYIIMEGKALVTRREDFENLKEPEQELMELTDGNYFGERALIEQAPRAANVKAKGRLKCLYISKDAFEEVLGPLQAIIDDDRKWREQVALKKQLLAEAEGLSSATRDDFTLLAIGSQGEFGEMVLAQGREHSSREYTIKALSKRPPAQLTVEARKEQLRVEQNLLAQLGASYSPYVPLTLTVFEDSAYVYSVYKTKVVTDLDELINKTPIDEGTACYLAACIAAGLEYLHENGVVYRNLSPENISIDADGKIQLLDLRFGIKIESGAARDYCGLATYLSPEQVQGTGHSVPVDYWGLGILIFEILTGSAPWVDEEGDNSEIAIYNKITKHAMHPEKFPFPSTFSEDLVDLITGLLNPEPDLRIGVQGTGPEKLRAHPWFIGLQMDDVQTGTCNVPYKVAQATKELEKARLQAGLEKGLQSAPLDDKMLWCEDYSSSFKQEPRPT